MTTEVRVFDPLGNPLAFLDVVPKASHIINDIGDAEFDISLSDPAATEGNLQFGNIILILHDQLPPWVGFIDPASSRSWGEGKVNIKCLSAESIFDMRFAMPTLLIAPPGAVLREMLTRVQAYSSGGIQIYPGDIFMGGRSIVFPRAGRVKDIMDKIAKQSRCDWSVTHRIVDGKLRMYANLYHGERGVKSNRTLSADNTKIVEPIFKEEGVVNNCVAFAKPPSSGELKVSKIYRDNKSISKYGLRMYLGEANVDEDEALDYLAKVWLYTHAYPRGIAAPTVINYDNTFADIALGNIYPWDNHGVTFRSAADLLKEVRLTGFEVNYAENVVNAVVETTVRPFNVLDLVGL